MKINGREIVTATIPIEALTAALQATIVAGATGISSTPSGQYKKIVAMEFNPTTGDLKISYEE